MMVGTTRRQFLGSGLAATAALTVGAPAFAAEPRVPLLAALYDTRFPAARAFANEAGRRGARPRAIGGAGQDLWLHELSRHWHDGPLALAGMTTHEALVLLTMVGREAGMRVVYRVDHLRGMSGNLTQHFTYGPHDRLSLHPALEGPSSAWDRTAARIVSDWPPSSATIRTTRSTIDCAPAYAACPDALVTWLMVPASMRV